MSTKRFDNGSVDATLRLLASLPVPQGLEARIQARLAATPRQARILAWPVAFTPSHSFVRAAAAAGIVVAVAGGGWGIYSRVQPVQPLNGAAAPQRVSTQSGFSNAGAMRTPQTLNGPVLAHPADAATKPANPAAKTVKAKARKAKTAAASKSNPEQAAAVAK